MYLFSHPTSIIYSSPGPRCCCVVWTSATNAAVWLRHRTDYRVVNHMAYLARVATVVWCVRVCATVCLTVMLSFSDTTDVLTIGHSFKIDRSRTPLFYVAQYEDNIVGLELNLRKLPGRQWESNPQPSEQLRLMTIKTSASTETANGWHHSSCCTSGH